MAHAAEICQETSPDVKAILHARTPEIVALSGSVTLRGAVLLSGNGIVLAAPSIYNLVDRAFQVRQNAPVQQQALALRGKVTYLVDLPQPAAAREEPAAPAAPAQQLGPPEGRGWVYWAENVSR